MLIMMMSVSIAVSAGTGFETADAASKEAKDFIAIKNFKLQIRLLNCYLCLVLYLTSSTNRDTFYSFSDNETEPERIKRAKNRTSSDLFRTI